MSSVSIKVLALLCLLCLPRVAAAQGKRQDPEPPLTKQRIQRLSSGELYALAEFYVRDMRRIQKVLRREAGKSKGSQAACIDHHVAKMASRVGRAARWQRQIWQAIRVLNRQRAVRKFTKLAHARQRVQIQSWAALLCGDRGQILTMSPEDEPRGCVLPAQIEVPDRVPQMPALHTDPVLAHGPGDGLAPRLRLPGGQGLRVHFGGALEQGYDTNPLLCHSDRGCPGAGYGRLTAHLDLSSEPRAEPQPYSLRLRAAVAHRQYFASAEVTSARARDVEADAELLLELFPHETLTVGLSDRFARTNLRWSGGPAPRQVNRAGLYLMWTPGGEAVELTGSYTFGLELLRGPGGEPADRSFHEAALTARWWFFARTSLVVDAAVQVRQGDEATPRSGLVFSPSTPLRTLAGMEGLLTRRLHLTALAGYGNAFHEAGDSFSGPLARVEASYIFGRLRAPVTRAHLSYERTFADSHFSNVVDRHELRVGFERFPAEGLQIHALARWRHSDHTGFAPEVPLSELQSHELMINLTIGYKPNDWLYLAAGYQLELRDTLTQQGAAGIFAAYTGQYQRHQLFGRLGCSY